MLTAMAMQYKNNFKALIFLLFIISFPSKFFKADGLFSRIAPTVGRLSKSKQPPQVATPFFSAHWRIPHILSQNTVLTPSTRHP